eukprot:TRINITY_DN1453_c0_g3_i3.p1 TRINITY_DN1453_c0_g3~~TRINITY_DN1453_c0_g3_i3.p1  ORF type:complete len:353 (-),score=77.66 TRINITY_DN1453_c0_g3_i3:298-1356(-)
MTRKEKTKEKREAVGKKNPKMEAKDDEKRHKSASRLLRSLVGSSGEDDYWGEEEEEDVERENEEGDEIFSVLIPKKTTIFFKPKTFTCLNLSVKEEVQKQKQEEEEKRTATHPSPSTSPTPSSSASFECTICYEIVPDTDTFYVLGCRHALCTTCAISYLEENVKETSNIKHDVCYYHSVDERTLELFLDVIYGVRCPFLRCPCLIEVNQLFNFTSRQSRPDIFARVDAAVTRLNFLEDSGIFCPRCKSAEVIPIEEKGVRGVTCNNCSYKYCCSCSSSFHPGVSCLWKKLKDEKGGGDYFNKMPLFKGKDVSSCPKCFALIEKNGGCDHMHCSRCNTDFSWLQSRGGLKKK